MVLSELVLFTSLKQQKEEHAFPPIFRDEDSNFTAVITLNHMHVGKLGWWLYTQFQYSKLWQNGYDNFF